MPRRGFTPQGGIDFDSPAAKQQKRKIPKGIFLFCDYPQVLLFAPSHIARKGECEGETFAGFPTRVQLPARRRPILRSKIAAPKKYDHPLGGRIFLVRRFCCAKSVACGRVIEREWGNPSKVPPSHSPFLAVGGSAGNKTCGHPQKKRRPRASLFLEQGIRYRRVKKEGGRRASAPSEEKKQDPCGGDCSQPPR